MSLATKRKHVLLEFMKDDYSPPKEGQEIVKVISSRGNNLHEVESSEGTTFLVSMPTKFRKNIWVKRGDFILVESIPEGDKVKAEMVRPLTHDHVKHFKKSGIWPEAFNDKQTVSDDDSVVNQYDSSSEQQSVEEVNSSDSSSISPDDSSASDASVEDENEV